MAVDRRLIGTELSRGTVHVDPRRVCFFADSIGETDPVHRDERAAAAAGHKGIPLPPTFLFTVGLDAADPLAVIERLGLDVRQVLHGSQAFRFHAPAHAGDDLHVRTCLTDVYDKRGGALEFVVQTTEVRNGDDELVAELDNVMVVKRPVVGVAQ